ncbi:hypothetical protein CASFOL_024456 [Castilleja foliolosa]|uniref:Transmembrane protein n=1 Tax=Castilleja foliolosa TaxID=1961234 RepID=A0ABD3CSB2_9LAMI
MASNYCRNEIFFTFFNSCRSTFEEYCKDETQAQLDAPMPWIGLFIAAASATCAVTIAADVFNGFRNKKLWFPSKYFSLNSFSLTVLAVAMKLPVDLTSKMDGINDQLARVSSLVLMSISMTNFMASLGFMENNEIMLNLAALGILVITIAGNVLIRLFQIRDYTRLTLSSEVSATVYMLIFLVILCSSAVMIRTAKRYIESQYNQMHKRISNERVIGKLTSRELRIELRRYWMMTESGSPQFVIAHSVPCVTAGVMCLVLALTLLVAHIRIPLENRGSEMNNSDYKWSTTVILSIQTVGVAVGTVAPLLRWFAAARFKSTTIGKKSFRDEFKVEPYWTQTLKQWRDSSIPSRLGHRTFRKKLHDANRLLLNLFIGVQILLVLSSKLVLLVSAIFVKGLLFCFSYIKIPRAQNSSDSNLNDLSDYVLLLEFGAEVPKTTLQNICNEVDKLIRTGEKKQPKKLIQLLQKSVSFNIQSSHFQERPDCWSLPVVTLTSIAVSLPNITIRKAEELLIAVSQGLYFAKLIEKILDSKGELASIRKAADVVWVGVELNKKWLDKDLHEAGRAHKETLQELCSIAETTVKSFKDETNNYLVQDPLNWPEKVIAANSMQRITQLILLAHDDDHLQTDDEMFERLSIVISDILAACFTNLARVIMLNCHSNAIKEREKNIRQAAVLLGESEEILEIFQLRELRVLGPDKEAKLERGNGNTVDSVQATFSQTVGGHV